MSKLIRHTTTKSRLIALFTITLFVLVVLALQMFPRRAQAVSSTIVISQIYGAGGNAGATLRNDYIELFNKGNSPVSLNGWSVQYASATGTGSFSANVTALTNVTLQPGQYYLVQESGGANGAVLPTADATGTIAMAAGAGKVIVANTTTGIACNGSSTLCTPAQLAQIVDLVGYGTGGSGANFFEGSSPAPTITTTTADFRDDFGCTDTDQNGADFSSAVAPVSPGTPAPRNTTSTLHPCTANQPITPTCPGSLSTAQGSATSAGVSATDPDGTVTSASITSAPVTGITLTGFTPAAGVGGTANATLSVANTTAPGTYSVVITYQNNDSPTPQTANCTVVVTVTPPNQPIVPTCAASLNVNQGSSGSANVSATDQDGTVTSAIITSASVPGITLDSFVPAGSLGGTATATLNVANTTALGTYNVSIQWTNNDSPTPQSATCTVVVNVVPPPGRVTISQVYGGGGNTGSTFKNDFIELLNHTSAPINLNGWSVQVLLSGTWNVTPLTNFTLQPGQYYLIQESQGAGGTVNLPTPDAIGTITVGSTNGLVALVSSTTPLTGSCPSNASIVDLVGYAATTTCFEGSGPAPTPDNTTAEFRRNEGCFDTDDNTHDFVLGAPNPRNSSSPLNACGALLAYGTANPSSVLQGDSTTLTVYVSPGQDPTSTGVAVTADLSQIGGSPTQSFSGSGGVFSFVATVPVNNPTGMKSLPVTVTDLQSRSVSTNILVSVLPLIADHITISQVYGGGGNTGATYTNDYVELYNPTANTVNVTGWSLQYASSAGTSWTNKQPIGGVIGPGEYYLVQLASGGAVGAPLPVTPNISGSINISATTGKIALVSNSVTMTGGCPLGTDPDIVDFVGYGTGASCREGSANAPAPSNSTAIFRKNGGSLDADQNGTDFQTGVPNPRRTAIITELGPWLAGTDPGPGDIDVPHDASITVNFSEPVNVDPGWYSITCAGSGAHSSATEAHTNDFKTYAITPNVNFNFSEQCTVTIFGSAIHDQDLDDSEAGTDTVSGDETWSFSVVAAGQPAPYPPSVHTTLGNPSNATSSLGNFNNYLMEKPTFSLAYNRDNGTPNWVSWHLSTEWYGTLARVDTFRPDPQVDPSWYRVQAFDYSGSGFDRGHMTPNADRDNQNRVPINQETFLMSNMVPQAPANNQGPWGDLEAYLRTQSDAGSEIYIIAGPHGTGGVGSASPNVVNTIANGHVTVPSSTWKVALFLPLASGNDISRIDCSTRTLAVIMPNNQSINSDWHTYITTVDAVEALTGYDFFSNVPEPYQRCIEAGTDGNNPPLDTDADGVPDTTDNCPFVANADQTDTDNDGAGNACDSDDDNDGIADTADNCPLVANADQADGDGDGIGTACDPNPNDGPTGDLDGDGILNNADNCPNNANADQADNDGDHIGDACDEDDDNDGVPDTTDNCQFNANPSQANNDGDALGDVCDPDDDNDGVADVNDNCPLTANADQTDTDHDGVGNACDSDDDNDGVPDANDNCPLTANADQIDTDNDGAGNACDFDDDNDGVPDTTDNCPFTANPSQSDVDHDGIGDACDPDNDNDGVPNATDNCPFTYNPDQADTNNDGVGDACTNYQFPAGGAFVIGNNVNLTGGSTVYFWGSQWSQNNPMSGGSGPASFKGFENSNTAPTCGGSWTTNPGGSSTPPATVPQFMAVIVASSVNKSGSTISGNITKIVIIRTNPGYGPSPSQTGTGTVVAVICVTGSSASLNLDLNAPLPFASTEWLIATNRNRGLLFN